MGKTILHVSGRLASYFYGSYFHVIVREKQPGSELSILGFEPKVVVTQISFLLNVIGALPGLEFAEAHTACPWTNRLTTCTTDVNGMYECLKCLIGAWHSALSIRVSHCYSWSW